MLFDDHDLKKLNLSDHLIFFEHYKRIKEKNNKHNKYR
jgi:hypothetical protein